MSRPACPARAPDFHRQVEIPPGQPGHGRHAELGPVDADGGAGGERLPGRGHLADRQDGRSADLAYGEGPADGCAICGRTAYRIVREALTNARKYAPGAPVLAQIGYRESQVRVVVSNGPAPRSADSELSATGSGLGIVGLRQRVELMHGTLRAGSTPDGGFRLEGRAARVCPDSGARRLHRTGGGACSSSSAAPTGPRPGSSRTTPGSSGRSDPSTRPGFTQLRTGCAGPAVSRPRSRRGPWWRGRRSHSSFPGHQARQRSLNRPRRVR